MSANSIVISQIYLKHTWFCMITNIHGFTLKEMTWFVFILKTDKTKKRQMLDPLKIRLALKDVLKINILELWKNLYVKRDSNKHKGLNPFNK